YRVDRFLAVAPAEPPAERPEPLPEVRYDDPSHPEVVIHLAGRAAREAEDEAHLGNRVRRLPDGGAVWRFRCPPSEFDWLTRFLLRFGGEARVEAPPELRHRLRQTAKETLDRYPER